MNIFQWMQNRQDAFDPKHYENKGPLQTVRPTHENATAGDLREHAQQMSKNADASELEANYHKGRAAKAHAAAAEAHQFAASKTRDDDKKAEHTAMAAKHAKMAKKFGYDDEEEEDK